MVRGCRSIFCCTPWPSNVGRRAICVILSGTGADGSLGLQSIKEKGGLVIAQSPDEAGFDGMPLNAIATGCVDLVCRSAKIPSALIGHDRSMAPARRPRCPCAEPCSAGLAPQIVELLRTNTAHDFRLYKPGTLRRRIERRMGLRGIAGNDVERYLDILRDDAGELDLLAKDLLINVTSFFRDAAVFKLLGKTIVPDLVRNQPPDQPLRVWVSGCSTGEEAYSLAMLFREAITAAKRNLKLQVFASDVDPDAIASAREGAYPDAIEADVAPGTTRPLFYERGWRVTGYRPICARRSRSRCRMSSPIPRSPGSTSCRAETCSSISVPRRSRKSSRCSISRCVKAAFFCSVAPRRSATSMAASRWCQNQNASTGKSARARTGGDRVFDRPGEKPAAAGAPGARSCALTSSGTRRVSADGKFSTPMHRLRF